MIIRDNFSVLYINIYCGPYTCTLIKKSDDDDDVTHHLNCLVEMVQMRGHNILLQ